MSCRVSHSVVKANVSRQEPIVIKGPLGVAAPKPLPSEKKRGPKFGKKSAFNKSARAAEVPIVLSAMGVANSKEAAPPNLLESPAKVPTTFGRAGESSPSWSPFFREIGNLNQGEPFVGSARLREGLAELFFDELKEYEEKVAPPQQEPAASSPIKVFYF